MTSTLRVEPYPLPSKHDLPPSAVDWHVQPDRAVVLIHDMQKYFLAAFPQDLRERLENNIVGLRSRCSAQGAKIAYTAQPGRMTPDDRGLLRDFWGVGMKGTDADRAITDPLSPKPPDWTFVKWRYSAFFRSDLLERMRAERRTQLVLCGVYGHVGILATALEAYSNDLQVFVVADAVGHFSAAKHRLTLDYTAACCAKVLTADEVVQ